ncbi:hypothetical protein Dvar_31190 [Desulfosarcina variabilis str. Montpellier]|uniref:hypothetical protein n=1 Tax=Desulfosarcina variabilis TaxID=2300 RepID=UPI003AFB8110
MQQITIRGLEPQIEQQIRKIAKSSQKSINQVIKEIIYKEFDSARPPSESLKKLAGGWTAKDAMEFEHAIQTCDDIDEDMWK